MKFGEILRYWRNFNKLRYPDIPKNWQRTGIFSSPQPMIYIQFKIGKDKLMVASNHYHFITHWKVESTVEEISEIIGNSCDLVRWWPSVYLNVRVLETGDEKNIGKVVELHTRGRLPYTLRWKFRVVESRKPYGYTIKAWGDFNGTGVWTFEQDGSWVKITYEWKIWAEKLLLRYFSFLLKPIFAANHNWAMARGEESLRLELVRRAATPQERTNIPKPPKSTS